MCPLEARLLSAAWITLPLSENAAHALLAPNILFFSPPPTDAEERALIGRGALRIPQPFGDSWHLLIIRVFLIIVETVPVEGASRERHVKTSSTVKDQTASVMGKLVRGAA